MNRKIIIVGNGFDISLGLKTSYKDFIFHLYKKKLKETQEKGSLITGRIVFKDAAGTEFRVQQKSGLFYTNIDEYLEGIIGDLEKFESLESLIDGLRKVKIIFLGDDLFNILVNQNLWCDVEYEYYKILLKIFSTPYANGNTDIQELNKSLGSITDELHLYIKAEQETRSELLLKEKGYFESLIKSILNHEKLRDDGVLDKIDIINFNYTNTFHRCLDNYSTRGLELMINIHGSVTDETNPIIFGYGDDVDQNYQSLEDANDDELLMKFKAFQYSRNDNYQLILSSLSIPFEVHIVGHSCGLSDRTLLKTIFESENCKGIYNYHYQAGKEAIQSHITRGMHVSRHFSDKIRFRELYKEFDPRKMINNYKDSGYT